MDPEVRAFYAQEYDEDARLRSQPHGVLERVRTQELLARFLPPPPARVLDVGGGTGVHAEWLATRSAIPDVRRGTRRSASVNNPASAVSIRPDGHVAWVGEGTEELGLPDVWVTRLARRVAGAYHRSR
jgi:hypothetical protein